MARKGRPIDPEARYLSPRQSARWLGVSEFLIYKMAADGQIPGARRLGDRILIPRSWVEGGYNGEAS